MTTIDQNRPNMVLGSESFALDRGGVSRVGRLVSHVLADAGKDYSLLSLNESKIESELGKSLLACAGSRLRFAAALWQPNDRYTHFMYTHLGADAVVVEWMEWFDLSGKSVIEVQWHE